MARTLGQTPPSAVAATEPLISTIAADECLPGSKGGHHAHMPFVTGGLLQEWGPPQRALKVVQQEIRAFNGRKSDDDYCVDLAMLTWHNFREPEQPPGVTPGPVGRTQRRFIVWHSVPQGLDKPEQVRAWLVEVLPETERLVREFLPTKSKAYPAQQLGDEVVALRDHLASHE